MSKPRRTFIFSQVKLDNEDLANISTALGYTDHQTNFIQPATDITVQRTLKSISEDVKDIDTLIFADADTRGLYDLTKLREGFVNFLENYVSPNDKLTDATLAFLEAE
jgi:hypothetical protein